MGRGEKGSCGQERGQGSFREDGGQRFPGWGGGCVLRVAARGGGVVENLSSPSPSVYRGVGPLWLYKTELYPTVLRSRSWAFLSVAAAEILRWFQLRIQLSSASHKKTTKKFKNTLNLANVNTLLKKVF